MCSAAREKDSSEMILALPTLSPHSSASRTADGSRAAGSGSPAMPLSAHAGSWPGSVKTRDAFVSAVESVMRGSHA